MTLTIGTTPELWIVLWNVVSCDQ